MPYAYGSSYNASKATLHHYGNILRVGMSPLGVKVLTTVSGNIGTNILNHYQQRKLPETPTIRHWHRSSKLMCKEHPTLRMARSAPRTWSRNASKQALQLSSGSGRPQD